MQNDDLPPKTALYRSWGDAGGYILLCSGYTDIMCDPMMEIWDCAAILPVLRVQALRSLGGMEKMPLNKEAHSGQGTTT